MAGGHGYWSNGKWIETESREEAVYKWREEHGYNPEGVFDMGGGDVVDTRGGGGGGGGGDDGGGEATPTEEAAGAGELGTGEAQAVAPEPTALEQINATFEDITGISSTQNLIKNTLQGGGQMSTQALIDAYIGVTGNRPSNDLIAGWMKSERNQPLEEEAPAEVIPSYSQMMGPYGQYAPRTGPYGSNPMSGESALANIELPTAKPDRVDAPINKPEEVISPVDASIVGPGGMTWNDWWKKADEEMGYVGPVGTPAELRAGGWFGVSSVRWTESESDLLQMMQGLVPREGANAAVIAVQNTINELGTWPTFLTPFVANSLSVEGGAKFNPEDYGYIQDGNGMWILGDFAPGSDMAGGGGYGAASRSSSRRRYSTTPGRGGSYGAGQGGYAQERSVNWRIGL